MLNYWQPGYEWMGHGLQGHWCPSFAHNQLQSPDVSGLGNHGQLVNFANNGNNALVTSDGKGSLNFDGANYVAINDSRQLRVTSAFILSAWFRRVADGSMLQNYFQTSTVAGVVLGWNIDGTSPARLGGLIGRNTGTTRGTDWQVVVGGTTISDSLWHHAVFSFDLRTISIFLDGRLDGQVNWTQPAGFQSTSIVRIGVNEFQTGVRNSFFNGQLDDLRIYNRPLTAQEPLATFQADRGGGMGYQPPLRRSYAALLGALVLACDTGNYTLSGQSAGLFASRSLAADQAQYLLSGNAANTLATRLLSSDPATYTATGNDAATICARLLDGGAAAYALTGTDAGLIANRKLTADQAVCFLAGNNAELLRSLKLNAGSMQLQLDNFAASLLANRKISADGAQYLLVVSDANLTSSASGVAPYYYLFMMRGPQ
jgi:hypothetical protein